MTVRLSTVFRAKRLTLFVTIRSIFPANASDTISLNPSLCLVETPLIPSSEYASYPVLFGGVNLTDMHKYRPEVLCNTSDLDGSYSSIFDFYPLCGRHDVQTACYLSNFVTVTRREE